MIIIGYEIATANGNIVCPCIWSKTIVIDYDLAIIVGGLINHYWQHVGVSCWQN